ncbi:MAG TPA: sulfatase-like hydrolase/transferase [Gaiellaceae bacterium]|nr:sulfatase-like hydrolase/transferase [Gaiellaceae bacterium]
MKPSFMLIVVDCLRADTVARPRREWPATSGLMGEAASFATAYTTCPTTSPAFTSMLSGRYPAAHGVRALRGAALPDSVPSVAEELAKGGYRTWCSVTGPLLDSVGLFRGFEEADYRDIPRRSVHSGWGDEALAKVRELAAGDRPFFALAHVWDVHTPRKYPRSFDRRRYGRNAFERSLAGIDAWIGRMRDAAGDALVVLTGDHGENLFLEPPGLRWQGLARRITPRLPIQKWSLQLLERGVRSDSKRLLKLAPRYFWNHNQTLLEPLVRVPLAVAGPGAAPGARRGVVSHVDLAPTLLELAGLPEPVPGWQGTSLADSIRSGAEPPPHPVEMEVGVTPGVPTVPQHAIRDGSWKLITSLADERVADALYDLDADPRERRNLARERPDLVQRLRARLEELATESVEAAPMAEEDEAILAARLEELGYL